MRPNRVLAVLFFGVILPIGVYHFGPRIRANIRGAYSIYANPPVAYTVELEDSLMCGRTGELGLVDKRIVARRSDGSRLFSHELEGGNTPNRHRRFLMADGLYVLVDDVIGTTTTYRQYPAGSNYRNLDGLDPATDCQTTRFGGSSGTKVVGYDEILGYRTVKAVAESPGDRWTFWYAPELGCEILQQVIEFAQPGQPLKLNSRMTATKVRVGEPEAYLFDIPKGYREMSFLGHRIEKTRFHQARKGVALTPEMEQSIRENAGNLKYLEQTYQSKRP